MVAYYPVRPGPALMGGQGGTPKHINCFSRVWCPSTIYSPVILSQCLGEALRISHHQHRHHAVVLPELIYYFAHLAGSRRRGHHRAKCVLNMEVSYVRYSIGWIAKKFDYVNRVNKRFRL